METIIAIGLILAIYFLPAIIAAVREHHQSTPIFVLNLFLGWTFLGWVVALVWSLTVTDGPSVKPVKQPDPVENLITAKGGSLTYRVMAYRKMGKGELERAVWEALQAGRLKEPEAGGVSTLVTDIGR